MEIKFCPYCGHELKRGSKFCPYCGGSFALVTDGQNKKEETQAPQTAVSSEKYDRAIVLIQSIAFGFSIVALALDLIFDFYIYAFKILYMAGIPFSLAFLLLYIFRKKASNSKGLSALFKMLMVAFAVLSLGLVGGFAFFITTSAFYYIWPGNFILFGIHEALLIAPFLMIIYRDLKQK